MTLAKTFHDEYRKNYEFGRPGICTLYPKNYDEYIRKYNNFLDTLTDKIKKSGAIGIYEESVDECRFYYIFTDGSWILQTIYELMIDERMSPMPETFQKVGINVAI